MKRINLPTLAVAVVGSLLVTHYLFIALIQKNLPVVSLRRLAISLIIHLVLSAVFYLGIQYYRGKIHRSVVSIQSLVLILVVSGVLAVVGYIDNHKNGLRLFNTLLYPVQTIEIRVDDQQNEDANGRKVEILWFDNQFDHISFSDFVTSGEWRRTEENSYVLESEDRPATIEWNGRTGEFAFIDFKTGPDQGIVTILVNGSPVETIDLYDPDQNRIRFQHIFAIEYPDRILSIASEVFVNFIVLILVFLGLFFIPIKQNSHAHRRGYWLWYTLPLVITWSLALLALWPGLVGYDSTVHFHEAWKGDISDSHSVLYTLIIKALTETAKSPPAVAWLQIIAFALVVAWGLRFFEQVRSPRWVPWAVSVVMAFSLPNVLNVITYYKDIPYSISILLLSLMVLQCIRTNGQWLDSYTNQFGLGVVSLLVILFRHNGLVVPFIVFIMLILVYRSKWKGVLIAFAVTVVAYSIFTGPVYRWMNVDTGLRNTNKIILHHLGAHINAGTIMDNSEQVFLDRVLPLEEWKKYDCHIVNPLWYNERLNRDYLNDNHNKALMLLGRQSLENPRAELDHILCASSIIWNIRPRAYLYESAYDLVTGKWVVENPLGIEQASKSPRLAELITKWYRYIDQDKHIRYLLTWRPALALLAAIFCTGLLAYRRRNLRYLLFLTPLLTHTLTLIMVIVAQDYRYQYPALLVAIFAIGFVYVPPLDGSGNSEQS